MCRLIVATCTYSSQQPAFYLSKRCLSCKAVWEFYVTSLTVSAFAYTAYIYFSMNFLHNLVCVCVSLGMPIGFFTPLKAFTVYPFHCHYWLLPSSEFIYPRTPHKACLSYIASLFCAFASYIISLYPDNLETNENKLAPLSHSLY